MTRVYISALKPQPAEPLVFLQEIDSSDSGPAAVPPKTANASSRKKKGTNKRPVAELIEEDLHLPENPTKRRQPASRANPVILQLPTDRDKPVRQVLQADAWTKVRSPRLLSVNRGSTTNLFLGIKSMCLPLYLLDCVLLIS